MSTPPQDPTGEPRYSAPPPGTPYSSPGMPAPHAQGGSYQPAPAYPMAAPYQGAGIGAPGPGEPFDGAIDPDDLSRPLYGATFGQAVRRFFRSYAKFTGRASRSEYWWVALFTFLIELIPMVIYFIGLFMMLGGGLAFTLTNASSDSLAFTGSGTFTVGVTLIVIGAGLMLLIGLGLIVPSLAIIWRRLHDSDKPGPMFFLGLIPYAGGIILFVFSLLPPKVSGRRFDQPRY